MKMTTAELIREKEQCDMKESENLVNKRCPF